LIYSQSFLSAHGLAVTWDNPDIHLERAGAFVASTELEPGAAYEVVASIWNGSTNAPVVALPVRFFVLRAGIGTPREGLGEVTVDLGVKGAPGVPAEARLPWTTPNEPGHYCLQVEVEWFDDANPANNLGQENTLVKALNSRHAVFEFPLRNSLRRAEEVRLVADAYTLPPREPCSTAEPAESPDLAPSERLHLERSARQRHARGNFPVPAEWSVAVEPQEVLLAAEEQSVVKVEITAPDEFVGTRAMNVNAFAAARLVGGLTLVVTG